MSEAGVLRVTTEGQTLTFGIHEKVTIGRHPDSAVTVLHSKVSRHHAEVSWDEGRWTVRDVGSANGTFVGGELISELELTGPVKINIGAIDGPSLTLAPDVVDEDLPVGGETVAIGSGGVAGTRSVDQGVLGHFMRRRSVTRIGRAPDNDLVIDEDGVSWYHAELRITASEADLVDLNSRNGTFVNGRAIERVHLEELDLVTVGTHLFRFTGDALVPVSASSR